MNCSSCRSKNQQCHYIPAHGKRNHIVWNSELQINICKNDSGKNTLKNLQKQFARETYLPVELALLNVPSVWFFTEVSVFELIQQNIVHQSKKSLVLKTDNKIHKATEYKRLSQYTSQAETEGFIHSESYVSCHFLDSIETYQTTDFDQRVPCVSRCRRNSFYQL